MLNLTRLSFFFLIAAVFLAPLIGGQFEFVFAGPLYMLVLLSAFLLFISGKSTSPSLFTKGFDVIALALFVILTIIAGLGTAGAHVSVVQIVSIACFFAVFLLGRRTGRLGSETPILTAIALAGILLGVSAIAEYQVMHAEYLKQAGSEYRVFGSYLTPGFFNPGFFAGYLAMALPITLGLYCGSKKLWLTSLAGLACLAQLAAILLTGARFGAIALLFGLICFIIALTLGKALSRQTLLRLAVIAILSLVVLALFHGPMTYRVAAAHEQSHSLAFRLLTWQATANIAKNHILFGTGPGTFHLIFPQYCIAGFTRLAHNSYLQIAAETGIPALLAFIVGVGAVLLASIRGLRRSNSGNTAILSGLIAGIAASSIRNLTDSDWYVPGVALVFWFALGLASGISRRPIEEAPMEASPKRWVSILIGTITLILIAVIAVLNLAASHAENGRRAVETNNPKLALAEYQLASRFAPWSADYRMKLARAYISSRGELSDLGFLFAVNRAREAANLEPTNPTGYEMTGRIEFWSGRPAEALAAYREAEKRNPKSPSIKIAIADTLESMDRNKEALEVHRKILEIEKSPYEQVRAIPELVDPNYAYSHFALGKAYQSQGKTRQAIREFKEAIKRIDLRNKFTFYLKAEQAGGGYEDNNRIKEVYDESQRRLAILSSHG